MTATLRSKNGMKCQYETNSTGACDFCGYVDNTKEDPCHCECHNDQCRYGDNEKRCQKDSINGLFCLEHDNDFKAIVRADRHGWGIPV